MGSTFTIEDKTFTVRGLFDAGTAFGNNALYVTLPTAQTLAALPNELSTMIVTVNSMENVDAAKTALQAALGSDKADVTQGQRNLQTAISSLDSVKNISFIAFVAALGTAGLIILLIMVMLVRERRREIGVLKAIGAPNRTIGLQFVLEALVLVALGSVVGAAVASLASGSIASALISSSSSTGAATGRAAARLPRRPGRTLRRGQPAADLRDGERLPRRHCRGHRRGLRRRHHRRPRPGAAHRPHPSHRSPPRRIAMIEVKNLVRTFKSGDRTIKPVNDVSFELEQGTLASIVGKSGSGKSTLLSLLGALDKPTSGDVVVDGVSLASMPDGKLTKYRRRDIGFVFQQFNLIPNLSAVDNVMLPMEFAGVRKAARLERARQLLEQVQLDPDKHVRRINRLSGGEQQRVAIARALANEPKLILADEPTGNLDEQTGEHIIELLSTLSRDHNTTILVVTHDRALANKTDRRFRLQQGRLTEETVRTPCDGGRDRLTAALRADPPSGPPAAFAPKTQSLPQIPSAQNPIPPARRVRRWHHVCPHREAVAVQPAGPGSPHSHRRQAALGHHRHRRDRRRAHPRPRTSGGCGTVRRQFPHPGGGRRLRGRLRLCPRLR